LTASFTANPEVQPISNPTFEFNNTSQNATSFEWFFGDNTGSDFNHPEHTYDSIGSYLVTLVASTQDGCTDTAYQTITVQNEVIVYVPNSFTPDGDGMNDEFLPIISSGYDPSNISFLIYNRWGELIFSTKNIEAGWDGTYKGNVAQNGTYYWLLRFKSSSNNEILVFTGHVNLIR
jgi:gliding motility-associated-like protein